MSESILSILREEHRQAEGLIRQIEKCDDVARKKELYLQLKEELCVHMEGVEKTLYTHLHEDVLSKRAEDLAKLAEAENQDLRNVLTKMDNLGIESIEWDVNLKSLKECFRIHVEEEEGAIFKEIKEDFSAEELKDFADEFAEAKHHLDR